MDSNVKTNEEVAVIDAAMIEIVPAMQEAMTAGNAFLASENAETWRDVVEALTSVAERILHMYKMLLEADDETWELYEDVLPSINDVVAALMNLVKEYKIAAVSDDAAFAEEITE